MLLVEKAVARRAFAVPQFVIPCMANAGPLLLHSNCVVKAPCCTGDYVSGEYEVPQLQPPETANAWFCPIDRCSRCMLTGRWMNVKLFAVIDLWLHQSFQRLHRVRACRPCLDH